VSDSALAGPVLVIGTGLIGTSIGLALRRAGHDVHLSDRSGQHLQTAVELGAGTDVAPDNVRLAVVAVPPDAVATVAQAALADWPDAVITDVGSVKGAPLGQLLAAGADVARYVGCHPMAGSEHSGPDTATADLFDGRAWAVTPHDRAAPEAIAVVTELARACGATVVEMSAVEHDAAVAKVSHLPHLMSVLTAAQLAGSPARHLALSGQGLRDVTRVAAGDPALWQQIVTANAAEIAILLGAVRDDLDLLLQALGPAAAPPESLASTLRRGKAGRQLIPGKHGAPAADEATVYVQVPDRPGELARLFADAGQAGVNVEDMHIDHDPARPVGLVELVVRDDAAAGLAEALEARGWVAHR
jgi:prephenate dehydrogenase